jgi:hypothetical protein
MSLIINLIDDKGCARRHFATLLDTTVRTADNLQMLDGRSAANCRDREAT